MPDFFMNRAKQVSQRQTLGRLGHALRMFLGSEVGRKASFQVTALIVLMLGINGMNVGNSFVGRYFMSAIEMKDGPGFVRYGWMYVGVFALSTIVAVLFRFCEERLALLWRDWLTRRAVNLYLDRRFYLHLKESGSMTNPDQRIAEDVKALTSSSVSFVLMIINGTVTAISFSGVLWSISPKLFVVAVLYAFAGSTLTILLGRPLIRLNYQQADREADFRSELIRVRENAEGIAYTRTEGRLRDRLIQLVDDLVGNFRRIVAVNRNLNFFTTGYNYMIQLIPTLVVAPLFIHGDVEFGIIGQSAMAFATLLGAFSLVVTQFQSISSYASVVTRLIEFVEAMEQETLRDASSVISYDEGSDRISYGNLTLHSPREEHHVLVRSLSAALVPGRRVFITGPNEAAKHMLFRVSAGLGNGGTGSLQRPGPGNLAFLPEQPYLPPGTLRELLVPPQRMQEVTDEDILTVVKEVGLGEAIAKHDGIAAPRNWDDLLSLSEKQLAAVARAVLAKPAYAFLYRLDSALSDADNRSALNILASHGITCISVGHGPADRTLYDACLEIFDDGSWKWTDLR